jgi:Ca-activated chloride channel family protein
MPITAHAVSAPPLSSSGGRLVASDGRALVLERTTVAADAQAGLARVEIEQHFANPYADPLTVLYSLPLPADGALAGFEFVIGERRVVGEVDRRAAARDRFEDAILTGHTAALIEQERSSVFTQEIGNVPPGTSVVARLTVDQPLAWLDSGSWEWRFPTVIAPRYLGVPGRVADAEKISVDVRDGHSPSVLHVSLRVGDALAAQGQVTSPSDALTVVDGPSGLAVTLASGATVPDHDLVIRWPVAQAGPGLQVTTARPNLGHPAADSAYGLMTLVPPHPASAPAPEPRDLIVLLDTSGSMEGAPLAHAIVIASHLIESLSETDTLELIAFGPSAKRWRQSPKRASAFAKTAALAWLGARRASGGTEMLDAVATALTPLREGGQRQVVLITDGLIGFEDEVVRHLQTHLPRGSRLHAVGVGEAANRSLTGSLARMGRGRELIVGLGDDPSMAADRLIAFTRAPLVTDLTITGSALVAAAPAHLPDVYAGAPLRASLQLRPQGGSLEIVGRHAGSAWRCDVAIPASAAGSGSAGLWTRFARESVEDLEALALADESPDATIERIGCDFQIATRLTSWVAISETPTVDPRDPIRRERLPQALPAGSSVEGLGLRSAADLMAGTFSECLAAGEPMDVVSADSAFEHLIGQLRPGRAPRPPRPALSSSPYLYRGTARWHAADTVVIEIVVKSEPMAFPTPVEIRVRFADGQERRGLVDVTRTTRPGTYRAGETVRLVVSVVDPPADRPEITKVTMEVLGGTRPLIIAC